MQLLAANFQSRVTISNALLTLFKHRPHELPAEVATILNQHQVLPGKPITASRENYSNFDNTELPPVNIVYTQDRELLCNLFNRTLGLLNDGTLEEQRFALRILPGFLQNAYFDKELFEIAFSAISLKLNSADLYSRKRSHECLVLFAQKFENFFDINNDQDYFDRVIMGTIDFLLALFSKAAAQIRSPDNERMRQGWFVLCLLVTHVKLSENQIERTLKFILETEKFTGENFDHIRYLQFVILEKLMPSLSEDHEYFNTILLGIFAMLEDSAQEDSFLPQFQYAPRLIPIPEIKTILYKHILPYFRENSALYAIAIKRLFKIILKHPENYIQEQCSHFLNSLVGITNPFYESFVQDLEGKYSSPLKKTISELLIASLQKIFLCRLYPSKAQITYCILDLAAKIVELETTPENKQSVFDSVIKAALKDPDQVSKTVHWLKINNAEASTMMKAIDDVLKKRATLESAEPLEEIPRRRSYR